MDNLTSNPSYTPISQDSINEQEWHSSNNWSGPRWMSMYFSKKDNRIFVPKQIKQLGWTVNLGRAEGVYLLSGLIFVLILLIVIV